MYVEQYGRMYTITVHQAISLHCSAVHSASINPLPTIRKQLKEAVLTPSIKPSISFLMDLWELMMQIRIIGW